VRPAGTLPNPDTDFLVRDDGSGGLPPPAENPTVGATSMSERGLRWLADHELTANVARNLEIGVFAQNEWTGIWPHYVFNAVRNNDGEITHWESDGGITFGFGVRITEDLYNQQQWARDVKDTYAPNVPFLPATTSTDGRARPITNQMYEGTRAISVDNARSLMVRRVRVEFEHYLNRFLRELTNGLALHQHEFDALINFAYLHGAHVWTTTFENDDGVEVNWNISYMLQQGRPFSTAATTPQQTNGRITPWYAMTRNFSQAQYSTRRLDVWNVFVGNRVL